MHPKHHIVPATSASTEPAFDVAGCVAGKQGNNMLENNTLDLAFMVVSKANPISHK